MIAFVTSAFEALAFVAFAVLVAVVPYARRKRSYWTGRGVRVVSDRRGMTTTLPGVRLNDRWLAGYRARAGPAAAVLGLHDSGRPCALACDVRVAAAALATDGFAEADGRDARSVVPSAVDADAMAAVLPAMAECVDELVTSLEAVANRRLTVSPWTEVKKCAATVVATCVYGLPMVHSQVDAFAEQCNKALPSSGGGRSPATVADYFASYDLSSNDRATVNFKGLLRAAAAASKKISPDFVDQQVRLDMFEFVTGTIEPTAALVTAVLYELAHDQNIQNQLREHLDHELGDEHSQITIDQLDRMIYLENVLRETLRKYPLMAAVRRVTTKPYIVPDDSGVTLETGTMTVIPVHALHYDSRYFTAPEMFQPNRFPEQLSSAYIPYGSGPQSYIGKHFIGLEAKLIVAMLLFRYEVHVDSVEPGRFPDPFDLTSYAGIRVKVTNRSGVGESTMGASLQRLQHGESNDKKFLFF